MHVPLAPGLSPAPALPVSTQVVPELVVLGAGAPGLGAGAAQAVSVLTRGLFGGTAVRRAMVGRDGRPWRRLGPGSEGEDEA